MPWARLKMTEFYYLKGLKINHPVLVAGRLVV